MYCYASAHLAQAYGKEKWVRGGGRGYPPVYFPLVVTYCDPICNAEIFAAVRYLEMRDFNHRSLEVNTDTGMLELDSKVLVTQKYLWF